MRNYRTVLVFENDVGNVLAVESSGLHQPLAPAEPPDALTLGAALAADVAFEARPTYEPDDG